MIFNKFLPRIILLGVSACVKCFETVNSSFPFQLSKQCSILNIKINKIFMEFHTLSARGHGLIFQWFSGHLLSLHEDNCHSFLVEYMKIVNLESCGHDKHGIFGLKSCYPVTHEA